MNKVAERREVLAGIKPRMHGLPVGMITTYALRPEALPEADKRKIEDAIAVYPDARIEYDSIRRDADILKNTGSYTFGDI